MKQLVFFFLIISNFAFAQKVTIVKTEKIVSDKAKEYCFPTISQDGNVVAITTPQYAGLDIIDLKTKKITTISDKKGAGYEPVFSENAKTIYYRTNEYERGRKFSSMMATDIKNLKTKQVEPKQRGLSTPHIANGELTYISQNNLKRSPISDASSVKGKNTFTYIENQKIALFIDGKKTTLNPNGDGNYIWPRLSPDKTRILYTFAGRGTFICDLKGNIVAELGQLNASNWLNDKFVVGMDDKDDGEKVTGSEIVIASANGNFRKVLTNTPDEFEMYPTCSLNNKVVFHNQNGDIYLIELSVKE